jgi:hypothetical protein
MNTTKVRLPKLMTWGDVCMHRVNQEAEYFEKLPEPEKPKPFKVVKIKCKASLWAFMKEIMP